MHVGVTDIKSYPVLNTKAWCFKTHAVINLSKELLFSLSENNVYNLNYGVIVNVKAVFFKLKDIAFDILLSKLANFNFNQIFILDCLHKIFLFS